MDASEHDVLAYMSFPRQHRTKLHSNETRKFERSETRRSSGRADGSPGIFPNEGIHHAFDRRPCSSGQNDEWQTSSRYMMVEAFRTDRQGRDPIPILKHKPTKAA